MISPAPWAVLWDMDGTLVDTAELHFDAWSRLCVGLGRPFTRADFKATFGRRNPEIFHYLFPGGISDAESARLGGEKELMYRAAAREKGVELLPGARNLMNALGKAGARQAIGSSAPRENLELILELTNIGKLLGALVGMEDTSRGKPDPEVFLKGASRLGVEPSRCVVLEDAVAGIEAATAAGMRSIAVTFVAHHSEEALRAAGASMVVPNLSVLDASVVCRLISPNDESRPGA
ncbi:MAG: HAD family hydrolase [Planctomycetota bacterium]